MKPGGTEGGTAPFMAGFGLILAALGLYLFFDSVYISSVSSGVISGWFAGPAGWDTASRGIVFVPLLIGIVLLFYNSKLVAGWILLWVGLGVILVEILSRLRFSFGMKTSTFLILLLMVGAGVGLMMRGLREGGKDGEG
jgi:hypothetical protein